MNPIGIKQVLRLKIDKWLHIDRKGEYGMMASTAYLSPDTVLFIIYVYVLVIML